MRPYETELQKETAGRERVVGMRGPDGETRRRLGWRGHALRRAKWTLSTRRTIHPLLLDGLATVTEALRCSATERGTRDREKMDGIAGH